MNLNVNTALAVVPLCPHEAPALGRRLRQTGLLLATSAAVLLAACGPKAAVDPNAPLTAVPGTTSTTVTTVTTTTGPGLSAAEPMGSASTPAALATAPRNEPAAPVKHSSTTTHAVAHPAKVPTSPTGSNGAGSDYSAPAVAARPPGALGNITAIEPVKSDPHPTNGAGAVIGGLLGGVLGHQVGGGDGNKAATVLGAVGGAVAGNNVQKNRDREVVGYRFHVTLDNGQTREMILPNRGALNSGDRVRVVGDSLRPA